MSIATMQSPRPEATASAEMVEYRLVRLDRIRIDAGTQMRVKTDDQTVNEYRLRYAEGVAMPPIRAVFDGVSYYPWDGFHRILAKLANGDKSIQCEVRPGTKRDAIFLATSANRDNGLQRSLGDTRRAVEALLKDDEWSKLSDREISRHVLCTHTYVGTIRKRLSETSLDTVTSESIERTYTRGGKTVTMNTANIRAANSARATKPDATPKPPATDPAPPLPPDGLDQLVQMGGISPNARASRNVSSVHGTALPPETRDQVDARTEMADAMVSWARKIRAKFEATILEQIARLAEPGRFIATLLLHLGEVGEAVEKLDCRDFEGCDRLIADKKILGQLKFADGESSGVTHLIERLSRPDLCRQLNVFPELCSAPLLAFLLELWSVECPPRPVQLGLEIGMFLQPVGSSSYCYQIEALHSLDPKAWGQDGHYGLHRIESVVHVSCSRLNPDGRTGRCTGHSINLVRLRNGLFQAAEFDPKLDDGKPEQWRIQSQ